MEETVGARLTMNFILPGGLMNDIHPNFVKRVKEFISYFRPKLDEYDDLMTNNVIIQERLRNVGVLSSQTAVQYGATGPVLRGSGVPFDLRKSHPYGVYDQADFEVPAGTIGDRLEYSMRSDSHRSQPTLEVSGNLALDVTHDQTEHRDHREHGEQPDQNVEHRAPHARFERLTGTLGQGHRHRAGLGQQRERKLI
jgi:Ni,Fe-hydrogenase III large subunit